jgi:hypothetical protein
MRVPARRNREQLMLYDMPPRGGKGMRWGDRAVWPPGSLSRDVPASTTRHLCRATMAAAAVGAAAAVEWQGARRRRCNVCIARRIAYIASAVLNVYNVHAAHNHHNAYDAYRAYSEHCSYRLPIIQRVLVRLEERRGAFIGRRHQVERLPYAEHAQEARPNVA